MDRIQPDISPPDTPLENLKAPARILIVDPAMLNGGGGQFQRLFGPDGPFETAAPPMIRLFPALIET